MELQTYVECSLEWEGVPREFRVPKLERTPHGEVVCREVETAEREGVAEFKGLETDETSVAEPVGAGFKVVTHVGVERSEARILCVWIRVRLCPSLLVYVLGQLPFSSSPFTSCVSTERIHRRL